MVSRDVTFNKKDLFNGNLDNLGNDLRIRTRKEWDDWLNSLEVSQSQSATNASSREEDEELSSIAGDKSVGHRVEFAAVSEQAQAGDCTTRDYKVRLDGSTGDHEVYLDGSTSDDKVHPGSDRATGDRKVLLDGSTGDDKVYPEGVSKGDAALEFNQLYLDISFAPYLMPEPTPPLPAALLAAAIRGSALEQSIRAAFSTTAVSIDAEGSTPRSIKVRHRPWEAAFNAGHLATTLGTAADRGKVSKARFSKLVNLPANRPGVKEQSIYKTIHS